MSRVFKLDNERFQRPPLLVVGVEEKKTEPDRSAPLTLRNRGIHKWGEPTTSTKESLRSPRSLTPSDPLAVKEINVYAPDVSGPSAVCLDV
jgi:hypothetical protein